MHFQKITVICKIYSELPTEEYYRDICLKLPNFETEGYAYLPV